MLCGVTNRGHPPAAEIKSEETLRLFTRLCEWFQLRLQCNDVIEAAGR